MALALAGASVVFSAGASSPPPLAAPAQLALGKDTPWVLAGAETETGGLAPSLRLALRDLRKDWYAVFGIEPLVLGTYFPFTDFINQGPHQELRPPYPVPPPTAEGTLVFLGGADVLRKTLPAATVAKVMAAVGTAAEAHGCFVLPPTPGEHAYSALVCTGVDELGVAYAVYELSTLLGVDPQAYWTEHAPPAQQTVVISAPAGPIAARLLRVGGGAMAPAVQYRGFFGAPSLLPRRLPFSTAACT